MQDQTIINKMTKELSLAKENQNNRQAFLTNINNIKLLCELFLEEEGEPAAKTVSETSFSEQEIKAMLGNQKSTALEKKPALVEHDGANGDSIFDF